MFEENYVKTTNWQKKSEQFKAKQAQVHGAVGTFAAAMMPHILFLRICFH